MADKPAVSCARPTGGPVGAAGETSGSEAPASGSSGSPAGSKRTVIQVGKKAPDFVAPAFCRGEFTSVKLSDYLGRWVVLCFYPGDFTFVWATEVSAVADRYPEFQQLGVEVLSLSVDSVFVHKMWNDNELVKMVDGGVPFPMVSDAGGKVGAVYGVYDEDAGVEMRGRFLIDPDGVVQAYEILTAPVGRKVDETLRQVQAFQYVRASNGSEATPSGWTPGKPALQPGPELVGKVWTVWKPALEK